ncbi:MAG: GAF domain-containing protein [Akkermansiaceae bacterium]
MTKEEKVDIYDGCLMKLKGLLDGEGDEIVKMASVVAVLHNAFDYFYWTGFYRMMDGGLVVGPYQGTPACLRIAVGRGVCGTAVESGETQVVEDVHAFAGHIACDAASESEVVVPVRVGGEIVAVLDIDSTAKSSFDDIDAEHLERIIGQFF